MFTCSVLFVELSSIVTLSSSIVMFVGSFSPSEVGLRTSYGLSFVETVLKTVCCLYESMLWSIFCRNYSEKCIHFIILSVSELDYEVYITSP